MKELVYYLVFLRIQFWSKDRPGKEPKICLVIEFRVHPKTQLATTKWDHSDHTNPVLLSNSKVREIAKIEDKKHARNPTTQSQQPVARERRFPTEGPKTAQPSLQQSHTQWVEVSGPSH